MITNLTDRQKLMLAALSVAGRAEFSPVQIQKLFFLIDEEISDLVGGRQFCFEPYDYGPFDKTVYSELNALSGLGLIAITPIGPVGGRRKYALSETGVEIGRAEFEQLPKSVCIFLNKTVAWIRSLSFAQLVGAIYRAYPRMSSKSIFRDRP